jgi:hypothetical protein
MAHMAGAAWIWVNTKACSSSLAVRGVTLTLGLLDDLVGRIVRHQRVRGERTWRVEFAWAIRSFRKRNLSSHPVSVVIFNVLRLYQLVCAHAYGHRKCRSGLFARSPHLHLRDLPV